jgi:hypothetical protein
MRLAPLAFFLLAASAIPALRAEGFLDRVDEALTFSVLDNQVRARISGLLDLEAYYVAQPPPGLISTDDHFLFNPRLTLFFDAQLGPKFYVFLQSRIDRGFDPTDGDAQVRLDEYALRFTPWDDGRLNFQVGKFATIVGNWTGRHLSWENPFINAPLVYENVTAIYDAEAHPTPADFLAGIVDAKYEYNPVVWGPSYASGVSVAAKLGPFDLAAELKNAALASRPESWGLGNEGFEHPTWSARLGWRPSPAWNIGFSASDGPYFVSSAVPTLPKGTGLGDYREKVLAQDISFAWHHWQLWAEVYEARFQVPRVGNADTLAYYVEAKYKFTPQCFGAIRWNQQLFDNVSDGAGGSAPWGADVWRTDIAAAYRFSAHTQLKLQYSIQHEERGRGETAHSVGAQFTVRF